MASEITLPKFRHPPLIEVVHGVQFRRLPMGVVHPGLFFEKLKARYPRTETVPPLAPEKEVLASEGAVSLNFGLFPMADLPRAWFISQDDTLLVQLQPDRLLLNWRRGAGNADYPHFEEVAAEFSRVFALFEDFAAEQRLGAIEPDQCEMTYVNHLAPLSASEQPATPEDFLVLWKGKARSPWDEPLEDLSFNARYLLRAEGGEPIGRVIVRLDTLQPHPRAEKRLQLGITARGIPPSSDEKGVREFHELAHRKIVQCFAGLTTPAAQEEWERLDDNARA